MNYLTCAGDEEYDPLFLWDLNVGEAILLRHFFIRQDKLEWIRWRASQMEDASLVLFRDEQDRKVDSVLKMMIQDEYAKCKNKYSTYYLYCISSQACRIMSEIEMVSGIGTYLREHVSHLSWVKRCRINRRTTWEY